MKQIAAADIRPCLLRRQPMGITIFSALLLIVLAGCSRPPLPPWLGGQRGEFIPTPIAVTRELQLWAWPSTPAEDAHLQSLIATFEAEHPTIAVELVLPDNYARRLRTILGTDTAPDLFLIPLQQLPDLVAQGVVAPLPPPFATDRDIYPHLRRAMQVDGSTYCAPQSFYTLALFYNRTLFDAAGVAYPDGTWDWAALQAAATALTNPEANLYGAVFAADVSRWAAFLAQAGGTIVAADGKAMAINSVAGEQALTFYTTLVLDGVATPPTNVNSRWPGEAFAQGRAAMMVEASWAVPYLEETNPNLDYGMTTLPTGPAGRATVSFATCFAVAAKETASPVVADLLAYLTSADVQQSWFSVNTALAPRPSLAAQWRTTHPSLSPFIAGTDDAVEWQLPAGFQGWVDEMNEGLRRIFGGFIPASALLPEAESSGNALLGVAGEQ